MHLQIYSEKETEGEQNEADKGEQKIEATTSTPTHEEGKPSTSTSNEEGRRSASTEGDRHSGKQMLKHLKFVRLYCRVL